MVDGDEAARSFVENDQAIIQCIPIIRGQKFHKFKVKLLRSNQSSCITR